MNTVTSLKTITKNVSSRVEAALQETGGLLRLAPNWVPRSFLQPGLRIKLHPDDTYAYGANRGGIDERLFASTTEAANDAQHEEWLKIFAIGEMKGDLTTPGYSKKLKPEFLKTHQDSPDARGGHATLRHGVWRALVAGAG